MKIKENKLSTLLMLFIITFQVCGPFVYNASEIVTNVPSEVETSEVETSEVETSEAEKSEAEKSEAETSEVETSEAEVDEKKEVKLANRNTREIETWPLLRDTDVVKVDSLQSELDNYNLLKGEVVTSSKFVSDSPGNVQIVGGGEDVVGEWFKFVINDYVDVKFTITEADLHAENGEEVIRVAGNGSNFLIQGYKDVKVKVDTTYSKTGAPYVDDFLFYWQDIDANQIFGVDPSAKMAITTNSDIIYDYSIPTMMRFSSGHGSAIFDDTINAVSKFEDSSGFVWSSGLDVTPTVPFFSSIPLALYVKEEETEIEKSVVDENNDGVVQKGEILNYQIKVTNPSETDVARLISVRDSMLENLPSFLTFNDDVNVVTSASTVYTGNLADGTFAINKLEAGESVILTYSVTINNIPADVSSVTNIATDNGEIVDTCVAPDKGVDCDEVEIPIQPTTSIEKSVIDTTNDGKVEAGETLTYTVAVKNDHNVLDATNIPVRDTLLENVPTYLTFNNDVTVNPSEVTTTGDLKAGDFVIDTIKAGETVIITYTLTVNEVPADVGSVTNIATDNGEIVDTCVAPDKGVDCDEVVIPIQPTTSIEKSVIDTTNDGKVEAGETLTYTVAVKNNHNVLDATNIPVRDTLLENVPTYLTFNNDVTVNPSEVTTTGDLKAGDFVIDTIKAGETVIITYTLTVNEVPADVSSVTNIATDNGEIVDTCVAPDKGVDCDEVVIPIQPTTSIEKSVIDTTNDGKVEVGETLTYTVAVKNDHNVLDATNIPVRDTLLENVPTYLTFNKDVTVNPSEVTTTGDLKAGDFVIDTIKAGETVIITYTLTVNEVPADVSSVTNIATDSGEIVDTCVAPDKGVDCDEVVIPIQPTTSIEKSVIDTTNDGKVEVGETLTYTVAVTNNHNVLDATNIPVRDTLLENVPTYLTFNNDVTVNPSEVATTGDLKAGDFVIDTIKAGETVTITYSMTLKEMPVDTVVIENIATINGSDVCETESDDCDTTITPVAPEIIVDEEKPSLETSSEETPSEETPSEKTPSEKAETPSEEAETPSEEAETPSEEAETPSEDNTEKKTVQINKIAKTGQQSSIVFISMMLIVLGSLIIARVKRN